MQSIIKALWAGTPSSLLVHPHLHPQGQRGTCPNWRRLSWTSSLHLISEKISRRPQADVGSHSNLYPTRPCPQPQMGHGLLLLGSAEDGALPNVDCAALPSGQSGLASAHIPHLIFSYLPKGNGSIFSHLIFSGHLLAWYTPRFSSKTVNP